MSIPASWRTTLGGILTALCSVVVILSSLLGQPVAIENNQPQLTPVEQSPTRGQMDLKGMAIGTGLFTAAVSFFFTRDNKVTSEQANAK